MTSERPTDDADADAPAQWLDGLAGRPGTGPAHEDGARVRAALAPQAGDTPLANWRDIESRAGVEAPDDPAARPLDLTAQASRSRPGAAANDPGRWRAFGWAAALALAVGLVTLMSQPTPAPDPALRGVNGQQAQGARWLVDQPLRAADALASDLRSLKAEVTVTIEGDAAILHIQAPPGAVAAINARLSALETGLDADGRLRLSVVPLR
jgi:hypothetical protein